MSRFWISSVCEGTKGKALNRANRLTRSGPVGSRPLSDLIWGPSRAAVGHGLLPGDPGRGICHAVHAAPAFVRRAIETLERAIRQRERASMSVCLLGHITQVLAHRVDVNCGRAGRIAVHGGGDFR